MDIKENFKGHLSTINHHKMEVMRLCFKVGLYKQGLMHDLSKYSPKEFISGVVFYTGDKSPNTTERRVTGKSEAWLHHKGRTARPPAPAHPCAAFAAAAAAPFRPSSIPPLRCVQHADVYHVGLSADFVAAARKFSLFPQSSCFFCLRLV